jgi:hypothetical protein
MAAGASVHRPACPCSRQEAASPRCRDKTPFNAPALQAREMASFIKVVPSNSESEAPAKSIKSALAIQPPASTSSTAQPLSSSRPAAPASARGSSTGSVAGTAAGVKVAQEKVVIAGSSGQSVQVAIRVRPMVSRETEKSDLQYVQFSLVFESCHCSNTIACTRFRHLL